MVYRFNQAPTRGYEANVGARTTHESLNGYWVKAVLDERRGFRWNWRSRDTAVVLFEMFEPSAFGWKTKTQIIEKDHWSVPPLPAACPEDAPGDTEAGGRCSQRVVAPSDVPLLFPRPGSRDPICMPARPLHVHQVAAVVCPPAQDVPGPENNIPEPSLRLVDVSAVP